MSLDWVDNRFFTKDKKYLVCSTHGALYLPSTGECVGGPPAGDSLISVPLEVRRGAIFAFCPEQLD
jgi:nitrite reductase/ring-hydroxylating ferredoxin subunit